MIGLFVNYIVVDMVFEYIDKKREAYASFSYVSSEKRRSGRGRCRGGPAETETGCLVSYGNRLAEEPPRAARACTRGTWETITLRQCRGVTR